MATFLTVNCTTGAINTNMGSCTFDPKNIVGAFLCPSGYVIPASVFSGSYLNAPASPVATPSASGGTIAAGTYYYKITALNANGETTGSAEVSATTTGSTSSVALTWTAVSGATSYRIYKGSTAGGESTYFTSATASYTDTGSAGTAGTVPVVNGAFVAAVTGALQTQLTNDTRADNKATRIYPIANFFDFKDSSEQPVEEKFGYGQVQTVRDGIYDWRFRFRLGGLNLSNALRSYNGYAWSFLFIDSKNQLIGTQAVDATGAATIGAISPIEFYQDPFVPNDGKKMAEYWSKFRFQPKFINESAAYVTDASFDIISTINGLIDVTLTGVPSATAGTYVITPNTRVGGVNLAGLFPTALAAAGMWSAKNAITGAVIPITGVTADTNGTSFDLALTTGSPNYPAVGGKIIFSMVGPTELAAGNVPGYESNTVTITRVA